ncbi:MAG: hypothetical protein A2277_07295 [Desulfobacterales bacterium RIFOXYA12_FULL_46_15]|nr:MAG: hypothetical protein A2097_09600 [Desulfobacula sp. GWF2_41_7]OGR28460.1 MAG: hypothetical protein A2277_07295 [Desulfobacterales bacterium RIFOXYA12_FULL_46_15]
MNSQSIELDRIKEDLPLPKIVRKSFRVPVEDEKNIWVRINDTRYSLYDICLMGMGITVKDSLPFFMDQDLLNCEFHYFDITVKDLHGRIIHVSVTLDQGWKYGIQWTGLDKDSSDQLSAIVNKLKTQLMEDHQNSLNDI